MKLFRFGRIVTFGLGAAVGYYLGNREGRDQAKQAFEQAKQSAQEFWTDPKTQEQVHKAAEYATDTLKEKAPKLGGVSEKAADLIDKSTGYEGESQDHSNSSNADPKNDRAGNETADANGDVVSDPATPLEEEGGTTATRNNS
ncbi:hypothetical protein GCM10023190_21470 [Enteractinococcus fodinae]|uniref:YtxH domain-containing protein n=1 Tax=Enteractinococcus fodinae TaxID=684663 RepID=A0ABU2B535_9MICC|nr:hypothetical protein [Enteractinococcus fodinae]MDR7348094.1 hypothetical protein [Enteractinococcus fodinae]